jgi:hypothetical protein
MDVIVVKVDLTGQPSASIVTMNITGNIPPVLLSGHTADVCRSELLIFGGYQQTDNDNGRLLSFFPWWGKFTFVYIDHQKNGTRKM